ncbi:MAG: type I asparaginase [Muribaculaceae bacterium]|nr:type I asparaginase [Bacteroides sp.]MDE6804109.1 type I asparaginase [Muribaculaceae bacterium]MDE7189893.1 type I asparaginase [Muribaculaceae bacterium]
MNTGRRSRILMIYTGGTIGMIENPDSHALEPYDFEHLLDNVPKLKMLRFDIDSIQFEHPLDSSSMNPTHWGEIAKVISDNYDRYDGFVVLHGTDTMAYSASALSFMLENLAKPVIITGSQLPIGEVRTDGEENLITALQIAAARDSEGNPVVQEVAILFENYLWRGNRATKHSADNFNAFKSNNFPQLAKIGLGITFNREALWRPLKDREFKVHYNMDTNVMYIDLFPGISEHTVRHLLSTPDVKGVVLKTFGAGNGPTDKWFINAIKEAVARGVVIVNITQCSNGSVHPLRYVTGLELAQAGVVSGHDLTSEAAIAKLMFLFGLGLSTDDVKRYMEYSLCGEMST